MRHNSAKGTHRFLFSLLAALSLRFDMQVGYPFPFLILHLPHHSSTPKLRPASGLFCVERALK
jgi:hypothetical protein